MSNPNWRIAAMLVVVYATLGYLEHLLLASFTSRH